MQHVSGGGWTRADAKALDGASLLLACASEQRYAWEEFVDRFGRYIYFLVRTTIGRQAASPDEALVADLYSEAFVAFLEDDRRRLRLYEGRNGCSARSWIRVIVIRQTLNTLRRRKRHVPLEVAPELVDERDPLDALLERERAERHSRVDQLFAELKPKDRLLMEMVYVRRMPVEAVAAAMRTSRGAVYTRKSRIVSQLRERAQRLGWTDA